MGRQHSPTTIAVLNLMHKRGSMNYLEIERGLGIANALNRISHLRADGYIKALPKERGQLKRYVLTAAGASVIGQHLQEQQSLSRSVMTFPVWTPPAFSCPRPGAMQAFLLPSRGFSA
ncbi:MAG: hypothetical protein RL758_34 [Pseudomonadota bacterium]|jgi:hypothetical protein